MTTFRTRAAACLLALPLLSLAACGADPAAPEVATLPTTTDPLGSPGPASDGRTDGKTEGRDDGSTDGERRPQLRVDDTIDRRASIWNAYNTCLLDNGAQAPSDDGLALALGANGEGDPGVLVDHPAPPKAQAACLYLEPVQPPALDAATNPDFHDQRQAYVQCLQDGGQWVTLLTDDSLDWTYTEGHTVPEDSAELEQTCLVQAFGSQ